MSQMLHVPSSKPRQDQYQILLPQIKALIDTESDMVANMANLSAVLKQTFNFFWVGFYIVRGEELVLGPFQGTIACTRIKFGKGVCGTAWKEKQVIIVPNVHDFPGHIACDAASQSEIVLPLFYNNEVIAVLDIDSEYINHFDEIDKINLQQVMEMLEATLA